jgi:mono/diheme cytochrome c family protein
MKFSLRLSTFLFIAPLALAPLGCDSGDEGDDEVADSTDTTDTSDTEGGVDIAAGQMIHDTSCAVAGCHGAMDMVQLSVRVPTLDDTMLTDQVRNGGTAAEGTMPGFNENQIDAADLANLIAFLRQMYP